MRSCSVDMLARVAAVSSLLLAGVAATPDGSISEELVFFVQYIGTDYGAAVRDAKVVDAEEYREVVDLAGKSLDRWGELRPHGSARSDLTRIRDLVRSRAPASARATS
jgi:hypothetical protein